MIEKQVQACINESNIHFVASKVAKQSQMGNESSLTFDRYHGLDPSITSGKLLLHSLNFYDSLAWMRKILK